MVTRKGFITALGLETLSFRSSLKKFSSNEKSTVELILERPVDKIKFLIESAVNPFLLKPTSVGIRQSS